MRIRLLALTLGFVVPKLSQAAWCYFSGKDAGIRQPAQKVFITWNP